MTAEHYIKAQLAATVWREAGHLGGVEPLLAVAMILRNRRQAGWCGGDWMALLADVARTAPSVEAASVPNLREMRVRLFLQQVDDIFSGLAVDTITQGALYYAELHRVESEWFRVNICGRPDEHPRVAQVGQLILFQ